MITRSPVKPTRTQTLSGGVHPEKRTSIPLRSTPVATATTSILTSTTATGSTTTPHEAMVASQLAHINELVQKNRSLEQTIKDVKLDLSKSADDITVLHAERKSWEGERKTWMGERQKWMDERKVWAEGCDTMQACHRIQQYRVACALQDERVNVLKIREAARNEQLKRLQRDYKITMFQVREAELEAQVEHLQELRGVEAEARAHNEKSAQDLKARCTALAGEVKSKATEAQAVQRQCEQVEDDLRRLREAHADATATSSSASTKLARLIAERDALEGKVATFKRSLELAQDEIAQLSAQLANWQNLKKGEDADAEEARKKKAKLEEELNKAKERIIELEAVVGEAEKSEARFLKQKDRVEKLKTYLQEWKVEVDEQTNAREQAENHLADAQVQIASLEQKVVELQAQLLTSSKPKSSNKKVPPPPRPDEELVPSPSAAPIKAKDKSIQPASTSKPSSSRPVDAPGKPRPKPRLVKQLDPVSEVVDSDIEILSAPVSPSAPVKGKSKQKVARDDGSDGSEMGEAQKPKKNAKTKVTEKQAEPTKAKAAKAKKTPGDNAEEGHSKKTKPNSKKRTSADPPEKPKGKSSQRKEKEDLEDTMETEDAAAPKKKKRKINLGSNLFGGSQPATFDWNMIQPEGGAGEELGIPTQLSPMKDTNVVPRRLGRTNKG